MNEYGALVDEYWQVSPKCLVERPVPLALFPPKILHGIVLECTRDSAVRSRRLTAWLQMGFI